MESKHTPGPWMIRPDGEDTHVMTRWQNTYDSRRPVCELPKYLGIEQDERHANAALIAAAPDMYDALQAVMESAKGHVSPEAYDAGLRALAKAEGR